jgi:Cys-tRNA(Pro) deacylase
MSKRFPVTPATILLRKENVEFGEHLYDYRRSGAVIAAYQMGVDEHSTIKTLVMEDENGHPLIVLMHGDREVSTKKLAKQLGVNRVSPCSPRDAQRNTGYIVGGISPFGTRKNLPLYVEETILDLPLIYINAGRRGYIISMKSNELVRVLKPTLVSVAR